MKSVTRMRVAGTTLLAIAALALGACGSNAPPTLTPTPASPSASPTPTATRTAPTPTQIKELADVVRGEASITELHVNPDGSTTYLVEAAYSNDSHDSEAVIDNVFLRGKGVEKSLIEMPLTLLPGETTVITENVTLQPGDYNTVSIQPVVTGMQKSDSNDTITVKEPLIVPEPAKISLSIAGEPRETGYDASKTEYHATVSVSNKGGRDAEKVEVSLGGETKIVDLRAGETKEITYTVNVDNGQEREYLAIARITGSGAGESTALQKLRAPALADLVAGEGVTHAESEETATGRKYDVTVPVMNKGGRDAQFDTVITYNGQTLGEARVKLEAGQSTQVTFREVELPFGSQTIEIGPDSGKTVIESDENNSKTHEIFVRPNPVLEYLKSTPIKNIAEALRPISKDGLGEPEKDFLDYLIANPDISGYVANLKFHDNGVLDDRVMDFLKSTEQYHPKVRSALLQMPEATNDFTLSENHKELASRVSEGIEKLGGVSNLATALEQPGATRSVIEMLGFYDPLSEDHNDYDENRLEDVMTKAGVPEGCMRCEGQDWSEVFKKSKAPFGSPQWNEETARYIEVSQEYIDQLLKQPGVKEREIIKRFTHYLEVNDLLPKSVFELPKEEQELLFQFGHEVLKTDGTAGYAYNMLPILASWQDPNGEWHNIFQHAYAAWKDDSLESRRNVSEQWVAAERNTSWWQKHAVHSVRQPGAVTATDIQRIVYAALDPQNPALPNINAFVYQTQFGGTAKGAMTSSSLSAALCAGIISLGIACEQGNTPVLGAGAMFLIIDGEKRGMHGDYPMDRRYRDNAPHTLLLPIEQFENLPT